MSVRILADREARLAALYDSVSGIAFGPVFNSAENAEAFLATLDKDARLYSSAQLMLRATAFLSEDE